MTAKNDERIVKMQSQLVTLSALVDRLQLANSLGTQFGGDRNMYQVLGYPITISIDQYLAKYTRQDISGKVVDLPAIDTWRKPPIIADAQGTTAEEQPASPFASAMVNIITQRKLWHYLQRVDRLAGIGRYGVMLIGVADGKSLDTELLANALKMPGDVLFFSVFDEKNASVDLIDQDTTSSRFGLPKQYKITLLEGKASQAVHWSRAIHVAEDLLVDEIYGRPRIERVYNRLNDLEKIAGGGAEATWKVMDRGLHADIRDGFTGDTQTLPDLEKEIDEYMHKLRRFIRTQGVDINDLGSTVVDPTGMYTILIGLISAATGIPQRILIGSERGELASSQDQANWAGIIKARQTQFAEPLVLRPLIDRLVTIGAVPPPANGKYTITWPSLFELSAQDKATVADTMASAIQKIAPGGATEMVVTPDEFREKYMGLEPGAMAAVEQILDEEDATV